MTELQQDLDLAVTRLRELGANESEVADLIEGWDDFSDPDTWSPEIRRQWIRLSDASLLAELKALRMTSGASTPPRATDDGLDDAVTIVEHDEPALDVVQFPELDDVLEGSIPKIVQWVDGDRDRARAVIGREVAGQNRATLLSQLGLLLATT